MNVPWYVDPLLMLPFLTHDSWSHNSDGGCKERECIILAGSENLARKGRVEASFVQPESIQICLQGVLAFEDMLCALYSESKHLARQ